ncbi:MAG: TrbC/VirB2 family protein [bacterium]|nr:TrbC/VirB2 family protein [bacterium]MDZ4284246.1 TrbC/VirB2 family protein [Patescibacteria group bacterium]
MEGEDPFWPLVGITSIEQFLDTIIKIFILIGTPIAVLFMIYAGFLFVTARGSDTQLTKAKTTFFYTVIGIAVLFGASVLAKLVLETIKSIGVVP